MQWTETQNPLVIFGQITRFFFPPPFLIDFLMQLKILQLSRSRGSNRFTQEVINGIIEEALLKAKQWLTASSHLGEPSHIPVSPTELAAGRKEGRGCSSSASPSSEGEQIGFGFQMQFWSQLCEWWDRSEGAHESGSEMQHEPSGGAFVRRRRTGCRQGLEAFCWALCVEELSITLF